MTSSVFSPPARVSAGAHVRSMEEYRRRHAKSVGNPAEFWADIAEDFRWKKMPEKETFLQFNFDHSKGEEDHSKGEEGAIIAKVRKGRLQER